MRRETVARARAGARRERRSPRAAARPGARGRRARRAPADGAPRSTTRSPRASPASSPSSRRRVTPSDRPDEHDRHLANAERLARESLSEARRSVEGALPAPLRGRDARRTHCARWRASGPNGRRCRPRSRSRATPMTLDPEIEVDPAADGPGGADERRQARAGGSRPTHALVHGRRGRPRRARRRGRVRRRAAAPHRRRRVRAPRRCASAWRGWPARWSIESEPGRGTAISARVPAIAIDPTPAATTVSPIRVLIADDHPIVRDGLRGMLGRGAGLRGRRRGRRRRRGAGARGRAHARRHPHGPADARRRRRRGDPSPRATRLAGARARADDVRQRPGRAAGARRRRDGLPAQGRAAAGAAASDPRGGPRRGRARTVGRDPPRRPDLRSPAQEHAERARARGPARSSPRARRIAAPRPACSSPRRRSRPTCSTSTPSSTSATAPRPWRSPTSEGCSGHAPAEPHGNRQRVAPPGSAARTP